MSNPGRHYHIPSIRFTVDVEYHPGDEKEWVLMATNMRESIPLKTRERETTNGRLLSEVAPKFARKLRQATLKSVPERREYVWFWVDDSHGLGKSIYDPYDRACVLVAAETSEATASGVGDVRMVLTQIPHESVRRTEPKLVAWVVHQLTNLGQTENGWVASCPTKD